MIYNVIIFNCTCVGAVLTGILLWYDLLYLPKPEILTDIKVWLKRHHSICYMCKQTYPSAYPTLSLLWLQSWKHVAVNPLFRGPFREWRKNLSSGTQSWALFDHLTRRGHLLFKNIYRWYRGIPWAQVSLKYIYIYMYIYKLINRRHI